MWQFHKNCTCSQESDCICTGSPSKLNSFTARASSVRKLGATGFGSICCSLALRRCTNDNWKLWNSYDFRFFRFRMNSDAKSTHLDGSSQLGNLLGTQRDSEPWEAVGVQKGYSLTSTQANISYMYLYVILWYKIIMWLYTYGYLWRRGNGSDGHSHLQNDPTKELQRAKEMSTWADLSTWDS